MSVTIPTKVQENVQDVYRKCVGYKWQLGDGNEEYIKLNMGILE